MRNQAVTVILYISQSLRSIVISKLNLIFISLNSFRHMIEMDYTSEKRYDVSHCFNHVYVPENATYESWTNQVCLNLI